MNRFSETDKWKDSWFRKLSAPSKLLFLYILDTCDNAGFFEMDTEMCAFITKMEEKHVLGAIKGLNRSLLGADDRDELFYVKNFLRHQRNLPLNPENNAHKQILRIIDEKKIHFKSNEKYFRGLLAPLYSKGKGTSKGSSKGKVKVNYTKDFLLFWGVSGRGSKQDAFKNWKAEKDLPPVADLIDSYTKYKAHCLGADRTLRDAQGWISGRLWESKWDTDTQAPRAERTMAELEAMLGTGKGGEG